jgi:hypothetical protein
MSDFLVENADGLLIEGDDGLLKETASEEPSGDCCCERCCCTTFPSQYEFTLAGIGIDPFNASCCTCADFNATFTLDNMGPADCGTHFCAVYLSAPFSSCEYLGPVALGPAVWYMTMEMNGELCLAKLYLIIFSEVDLDTLCLLSPSQLFDQFCNDDGVGNTVARFSSDTASGGSFPDNCLTGNIVMGQPAQGPCQGWPDGISTFLELEPIA